MNSPKFPILCNQSSHGWLSSNLFKYCVLTSARSFRALNTITSQRPTLPTLPVHQNVRSTLQMDSVVQYPQVSATAIKMRSNGFRWALQGSASASSLEWLQALVRPTAGKHLLVRRSWAAGLSPNPSFDLPWSRGLRQGPLGSVWEGSLEWLQALTRPMAGKHLLVGRWRTAWLDPSQRRGTGIGKPLSCATTGVWALTQVDQRATK